MNHLLVISAVADDRTGIIEQLSNTIAEYGGNWTDSNLSRLGGKFAGVMLVEVSAERNSDLQAALKGLAASGIRVTVEESTHGDGELATTEISLVANDRPGVVGEISRLLARAGVSIESFDSWCEAAPMSSEMLFHAYANVKLPPEMSQEDLVQLLESLSDDLFVEVPEPEEE